MTESSSKTIGSYDFKNDNSAVLTDIAEDNPSLGVVLNEDGLLK